ncbi:MAG: hypothetical protein OEX12_14630 [Gammaproteobacteria bacterium]|nr:hypothetical protein [Gammaproteobacteria bacterium]
MTEDQKTLAKDVVTGIEKVWEYIGSDILGPTLSNEVSSELVVELSLDGGRLADIAGPEYTLYWEKLEEELGFEEAYNLVVATMPYTVYGY